MLYTQISIVLFYFANQKSFTLPHPLSPFFTASPTRSSPLLWLTSLLPIDPASVSYLIPHYRVCSPALIQPHNSGADQTRTTFSPTTRTYPIYHGGASQTARAKRFAG